MSENTATMAYPVVSRLDVGFDMMEDRLIVHLHTVSDGMRVTLITRRLMRLLLEHYAAMLQRTSQTASRAPVGQRDEVLRMEHVGALADPLANAAPPAALNAAAIEAGASPPVWLAVEAKLKVEDAVIVLGFTGQRRTGRAGETGGDSVNEPIGAMTLTRGDAHRVLAAFAKCSKDAAWDLERHAPWLTNAGAQDRPAMN